MFGRIRSEVNQCLQQQGKNSNIWKDKIKIPTFIKIALEYLCLEE